MTSTPHHPVISNDTLNQLYGHLGRTFKTFDAATAYAAKTPRARVYPIWDHLGAYGRYSVGLGEKRIVGYLVSIDPEPKPKSHYTGRVRGDIGAK